MSGIIVVQLGFDWAAMRPDRTLLGRRWDVHVCVDGEDHVFREGPLHQVDVPAGHRVVEVFFKGAGINISYRAFPFRWGLARTEVDVADGQTVRLSYWGGMWWHMSKKQRKLAVLSDR